MRKLMLGLALATAVAIPTTASARPPATSPNIVDTAIAVNASGPYAGAFDTLICLAANNPTVLATLSAKGQYTVFAPTDAAFEAIGVDGSNCAAAASTPAVTNILLYHVAKGRRDAADVTSSTRIRMLNGDFTSVSAAGGVYLVNDAHILATDVFGSNGVIHAIDKVLIP